MSSGNQKNTAGPGKQVAGLLVKNLIRTEAVYAHKQYTVFSPPPTPPVLPAADATLLLPLQRKASCRLRRRRTAPTLSTPPFLLAAYAAVLA